MEEEESEVEESVSHIFRISRRRRERESRVALSTLH